MKKIFMAAIFAAASFNAFGAACANGSILTQFNAGSCTINGWTLDSWSLGAITSVGYDRAATASDVFVSFSSFTLGNGTQGFAVSFSNNGLLDNGYFTARPGQPNDTQNWNSNFSINGAPVAVIDLRMDGQNVTSGNGQVSVQKIVYDPTNPSPSLGSNNILSVSGFTSTNPVNVYSNQNNTLARISVADVYQLTAGDSNSGATLSSYTNIIYGVTPQTGVPEPMSFVLMGAGLVGIAALRRRNG